MLILVFFLAARFESRSTLEGVGMEPQGSLWGCGWRWLASSLLAVRVGQLLCVDVAGQCVGEGARPSRVRFGPSPACTIFSEGRSLPKAHHRQMGFDLCTRGEVRVWSGGRLVIESIASCPGGTIHIERGVFWRRK